MFVFLWGPRKQSSTCKMMGPDANPVRITPFLWGSGAFDPPKKMKTSHVVQKTWHMPKASIEMFEEPMDAPLWQLVALSAGTGGSMLAVGSVAGGDSVVFPGIHVLSSWPEIILTWF